MTFENVDVDTVRRWWDRRPCNVNHSAHPIESIAYSAQVRARRLLAEPHELELMQPDRWTGKDVLEIGCGTGHAALIFARYGARVTALDLSAQSLRIAQLRARAEGVDITFALHNAEEPLSYLPPFLVDLIYSYGVIHHSPHPDRILRNLLDHADERTELRIMLYHRWSVKGLRLGLTNRRIARQSEAQAGCPVTYAYSRRGACQLLERNGWQVERMWVDHLFRYQWRRWPTEAVTALPWRILPDTVYRALAHTLGWHLLIIAKPKGQVNSP